MTRGPILLIALAFGSLHAQAPRSGVRQRFITFVTNTPVLGLPAEITKAAGLCSSDGLSYFDTSAGTPTPADLYTVSATAEVKHLRRKLPSGFTDLSVVDFYPASHLLVTFFQAEKRDDPDAKPTATEYILSLSDHDGDQSDLLDLRLSFKPLNVAAFASGEFLVIGWDTANQQPVLAILKEDGTVRRFVNLAALQHPDPISEVTLELLSAAAFVPWGDDVLLTFPRTTRPARLIRAVGQDLVVPLPIPPGYTLHDVLGSDGHTPVVARVQAIPPPDEPKSSPPPALKLFEFYPSQATPFRELVFEKTPPASVTCAAKSLLTAVFLAPLGSPAKGTSPAAVPTTETSTQLVIGTVRR